MLQKCKQNDLNAFAHFVLCILVHQIDYQIDTLDWVQEENKHLKMLK